MTQVSKLPPSGFADRLYFVVWLSALKRGFESGQELARAIGKGPTQLSQWAKKKPSFINIRLIAEAVGISPSWLDDPASIDAREPELWKEWYAARLSRPRVVEAPSQIKVRAITAAETERARRISDRDAERPKAKKKRVVGARRKGGAA